jgi:AcrR family transcriptional regulator
MRRKPPGRLRHIADAALSVLSRQGYRLTQMADIARECGLSAGALYGYVEGKEAVLHLALAHAFGMALDESDLPYRIISPDETLKLLEREIKRAAVWPVLSQKARGKSARLRRADLAAVAAELYELTHERRRSIWLLDRCADDIPEIAALYLEQVKARYLADFGAFLAKAQSQGLCHREVDPATAARAVLEMIAWLAMHRLRDPLPLRATEEQMRRAAASLVAHALSGPAAARSLGQSKGDQ